MALFKSEKANANVREKVGDYFLDLSKLVFAGVILASIIDAELPQLFVLLCGADFTLLALFLGIFFISRNEKE